MMVTLKTLSDVWKIALGSYPSLNVRMETSTQHLPVAVKKPIILITSGCAQNVIQLAENAQDQNKMNAQLVTQVLCLDPHSIALNYLALTQNTSSHFFIPVKVVTLPVPLALGRVRTSDPVVISSKD